MWTASISHTELLLSAYSLGLCVSSRLSLLPPHPSLLLLVCSIAEPLPSPPSIAIACHLVLDLLASSPHQLSPPSHNILPSPTYVVPPEVVARSATKREQTWGSCGQTCMPHDPATPAFVASPSLPLSLLLPISYSLQPC